MFFVFQRQQRETLKMLCAACVCSNLHVVSVGSVHQLQQLVNTLPQLLKGPLRCCRVVFVDDLDLGM